MKSILLVLALIVGTVLPAAAQIPGGVQQSGAVTAGHCTSWKANGVVQDAGAACNTTATASYVVGSSGTVSSHTGDTNEAQLAATTVPANAMGANGGLRITMLFSCTNSGNSKTARVRLGGSNGTVIWATAQTAVTGFQTLVFIWNNNATNSQKSHNASFTLGTTTGAEPVTSAIDTTAAMVVSITGQLATGTETISLLAYTVEVIPGV